MDTSNLYQKYLIGRAVSTDTRSIAPDSIFFALKGPQFNANEFAKEALEKGASYAVVDEEKFVTSDRCILVNDGLAALQALARHHREQLKIPVIGLTGSNGKTTTKELIQLVLSEKFRALATKGNLNNHIGVPLTILSLRPEIEVAIVEMGANHVGEIAALCEIAQPTHGLITNIGKAHIGTFGGFENILRAKSELYQNLIREGGTAFINSTNPLLATMSKRFKEPIRYPAPGDFYHAELLGADPLLSLRAENNDLVQTQMIGAYNFENVAAALCIGKFFGVDPVRANKAVAEYRPGNMRSQILKKGTNTIILDAYNANPSSMGAAIENLARIPGNTRIAILGDMYELEDAAEEEHRQIGSILKKNKIETAYLCGPLMRAARTTFPAGKFFETKASLMKELKTNPIRDAIVLVKGSRGMKMEEVVEGL